MLAHAGVAGETVALRDLLDEAVAPLEPAQVYTEDRAAIRACKAERYNASRSNLLDGGAQPLRDC